MLAPQRAATATTRTRAFARLRGRPAFLARGDVLKSPVTGAIYRIERMLGKGGFGEVYLAARLGRSTTIPRAVCIKVSQHIDAWIREAYFGQLLDRTPRAIAVYDRFALTRADGLVLYYLAIEYARSRRPERVPRAHRQGVVRGGAPVARSRASSRCWGSSIAASSSTAT